MEAYLLFQKLFTGLMQRSCLGGHKEVLFLEGLQVLEGTVDVVQYSITLLLKPRQVIPHLPGKKKKEERGRINRKQAQFHFPYLQIQLPTGTLAVPFPETN